MEEENKKLPNKILLDLLIVFLVFGAPILLSKYIMSLFDSPKRYLSDEMRSEYEMLIMIGAMLVISGLTVAFAAFSMVRKGRNRNRAR